MKKEDDLIKIKSLTKVSRILVFALICFGISGCSTPKIKSLSDEKVTQSQVKSTDRITIQGGQFIPDKISVRSGDEVVFVNGDDTPCIIASDPHPEHDQFPDLYSPPIYNGKSYSYTFNKKGYFGVHLESNPSIKAQIVVLSSGGETQ